LCWHLQAHSGRQPPVSCGFNTAGLGPAGPAGPAGPGSQLEVPGAHDEFGLHKLGEFSTIHTIIINNDRCFLIYTR
jgi:hypothetical protein